MIYEAQTENEAKVKAATIVTLQNCNVSGTRGL
jgi:hypothetical protein